ncbi:gamma-glutamyltransferase [Nocardioides marmoribigeumensis]|uniref:Gamma-glutamyltranspeptidase/glutathione hydrolase n=1 Tax=Nocardioides marmoribigeumensis TaxID=433649 RepID=A0ABU2BSC9_9ACTN|nr:gamma-glutamyltransferase [Nocardioides marmoribigeumensis]MDR7361552.1 gamma-glutamyltranspeptidase/glutathione hydrolase [Nocardioides marmoribigeumensis]
MTEPGGERRGRGIAVSAPNELAAAAGVGVAREGGNAVDAAVAAAITTMVSEVGLVSLTAGGFVTLQLPGEDPVTVDGGVAMPGRGLGADRLGRGLWDVRTDYAGGTTMTVGPGSVAVPGALKALDVVARRHGTLPWSRLLQPAVEAAAGFPHGSASYYYLRYVHEPVFGWQDESRATVLSPDGELWPVGSTVVVPHLEDTVRQLAEEGVGALYGGDLGARAAAAVQEAEGLLTLQDLTSYDAVVRPALRLRVGDWELATNPPPASGGVALTAVLELLRGRPAGGPWDETDLRVLARAQALVLGEGLTGPDTEAGRTALAEEVLRRVREVDPVALTSPSTATVSAADAAGGTCAITVSSGYGSGFVVPGTGLAMNNCLGEQELVAAGPHALRPGERISSNMAPTVLRRADGGAALAISSPGSDRIPTALAQVVALFVNGGLDLAPAVAQPRLHVRVRPTEDPPVQVDHEEDLVLPADLGLPTRAMPARSMYFGGVSAALWTAATGLEAYGDPRRTGVVAVHHG